MMPSLISGWPNSADCARRCARRTPSRARSRRRRRAPLTAAIVAMPELSISRSRRVHLVEQLASAGLVHRRERLDVGAGAEEHRVRRGDHQRTHAARLDRVPDRSAGPRRPAARSSSSGRWPATRSRRRPRVSSLTASVRAARRRAAGRRRSPGRTSGPSRPWATRRRSTVGGAKRSPWLLGAFSMRSSTTSSPSTSARMNGGSSPRRGSRPAPAIIPKSMSRWVRDALLEHQARLEQRLQREHLDELLDVGSVVAGDVGLAVGS